MVLPNAEVEANWAWARKHLQGQTKRVNLYHRKDLINTIHEKLSNTFDDNGPLMRRFEQGPFGHLLGWKCGVCNGQALNALIGRQILSPSLPDHELWFRVNETNIRFSCQEFSLITGLSFGATAFDPSDDKHRATDTGVFQRFCGGKRLTLCELWDLFKGPNIDQATPEDYLKVANILFLYLFAMAHDSRRKPANWPWVLVDKISDWNEFPWGSYCFKAFLHFFKHVQTHKEKYHIFGAVWSLQIWAIEAIPELATNIALIAEPEALPRCLKWTYKTSRHLDFHKLLRSVSDAMPNLEPSIVETSKRYFVRSDDVSWLSLKFIEPVNPSDLPPELRAPEAKKRSKPKVVLENDDYEPMTYAPAVRSKRRRNDRFNELASSSSNHICRFREGYIIRKVEEMVLDRIIPRLISHMELAVPDMITMMRDTVAQYTNQPRDGHHRQYGPSPVNEQVASTTVIGSDTLYECNELSPDDPSPPSPRQHTQPRTDEIIDDDDVNAISNPSATADNVTQVPIRGSQSPQLVDVVDGQLNCTSRSPESKTKSLAEIHDAITDAALQPLPEEANVRSDSAEARDESLKTTAPWVVGVAELHNSHMQHDGIVPATPREDGCIEIPIQSTMGTDDTGTTISQDRMQSLPDDINIRSDFNLESSRAPDESTSGPTVAEVVVASAAAPFNPDMHVAKVSREPLCDGLVGCDVSVPSRKESQKVFSKGGGPSDTDAKRDGGITLRRSSRVAGNAVASGDRGRLDRAATPVQFKRRTRSSARNQPCMTDGAKIQCDETLCTSKTPSDEQLPVDQGPPGANRDLNGKENLQPMLLSSMNFDCFRLKRQYSDEAMSDFLNWYKHGIENGSKESRFRLMPWEMAGDNEWTPTDFKELYSPRDSISPSICDALLNLMVYLRNEKYSENVFLNDWTFLDSLLTDLLMHPEIFSDEENLLKEHVEGYLPEQGGMPWSEISKVYGLAPVNRNHWVLYSILLKEQTIVVYDTICQSAQRSQQIAEAFAIMCAKMNRICRQYHLYKDKDDTNTTKSWQVKCAQSTPVQADINDSGVLCVKILECLITGNSLSDVEPECCTAYRAGYCYELFTVSDSFANKTV